MQTWPWEAMSCDSSPHSQNLHNAPFCHTCLRGLGAHRAVSSNQTITGGSKTSTEAPLSERHGLVAPRPACSQHGLLLGQVRLSWP